MLCFPVNPVKTRVFTGMSEIVVCAQHIEIWPKVNKN